MTDREKRDSDAEVTEGRIKRIFRRIGKVSEVSWILFGAGLLVGFLFGVSWKLNEITERAKFLAGNILSILALIVIVPHLPQAG